MRSWQRRAVAWCWPRQLDHSHTHSSPGTSCQTSGLSHTRTSGTVSGIPSSLACAGRPRLFFGVSGPAPAQTPERRRALRACPRADDAAARGPSRPVAHPAHTRPSRTSAALGCQRPHSRGATLSSAACRPGTPPCTDARCRRSSRPGHTPSGGLPESPAGCGHRPRPSRRSPRAPARRPRGRVAQRLAQLGLGGKPNRVRHADRRTPVRVLGPGRSS